MENKARLFQWRAKLGSIMALLLAALTFISVFTGKNYFSNLPSLFPLYLEEMLLHFYSIWKCACLLGFIRQLHDLQRRNFSCGNCVFLPKRLILFLTYFIFFSTPVHNHLNHLERYPSPHDQSLNLISQLSRIRWGSSPWPTFLPVPGLCHHLTTDFKMGL